jgi:hypothetical protein
VLAVALVVTGATVVGAGRRRRLVGLATAAALALVAALPVGGGRAVASSGTSPRSTRHNLVYTTVLPEVGPAALAPLGLPPAR